eukprot:s1644_g19.t1
MLGIQHEDQLHVITLRAGQFIFEGLRQLGIYDVNFVVDASGKVFGADYRVWRTLNLTTLNPSSWPPITYGLSQTAGGDSPAGGLNDDQIWKTLNALFPCESHGLSPLLVHPLTAAALLEGTPLSSTILDSLRAGLQSSDGQICCIFAAHNHWALIWGISGDQRVHWSYSDGFSGLIRAEAGKLAILLTVALDFATWSLDSWHVISQ